MGGLPEPGVGVFTNRASRALTDKPTQRSTCERADDGPIRGIVISVVSQRQP